MKVTIGEDDKIIKGSTRFTGACELNRNRGFMEKMMVSFFQHNKVR